MLDTVSSGSCPSDLIAIAVTDEQCTD
uniref:Uncharacterized protein n=1 Tax=Arundo donax TaxID=35708 RepID=A0A0A9G2T5_ARUDO